MSITIHLPADAEQKLRQAAARRGQTLEDYLQQLAISSAIDDIAPSTEQAAEEWVAEFRAWAASHAPIAHFVDDSRESIYEGRGE